MFAWHGWKLDLPDGWNPVKLQGDYVRGHALIADMCRPRMGLHWTTPARKFDADLWARKTLVEEVGRLASDEAQSCPTELWKSAMLYLEPEPPGRDVWVARSGVSGRTIEMVCHADDDDEHCVDELLMSLADCHSDGPLPWSVFDLSCQTPANWRLTQTQLNAGDLSLSFANGRVRMSLRQIAIAELALKQKSLEKWLHGQQKRHTQAYRTSVECSPISITTTDGRTLAGFRGEMTRRRRYFWARNRPSRLVFAALHDEARNRLVLLEGSDESVVERCVQHIGWAMEVNTVASNASGEM